jgi:hypothetical protein
MAVKALAFISFGQSLIMKMAVVHPSRVVRLSVANPIRNTIRKLTGDECITLEFKKPEDLYKTYVKLHKYLKHDLHNKVFDNIFVQHTENNLQEAGSAQIINKMIEDGYVGKVTLLVSPGEDVKYRYYSTEIDYTFDDNPASLFGKIRDYVTERYG